MDLQPSAQSYISAVRLDRSLNLAALCVLYYDYILTITSEIRFVWGSPSISPSFVLFVANRYVGILGHIPVFFEYLLDSSEHTYAVLFMSSIASWSMR
ncbi:hypothetical protein C8Q74DRAFT_616242 [Fomes fomentarius]|nr:hypothetical protein C8Q74DRAFT_616242 [Fomes fomentarius]